MAVLLLAATACTLPGGRADGASSDAADRPPALVSTGADRLVASGFDALDGMRVGLVVNHTARSGEKHLIDWIHEAPEVELGALFGPEHGIRGDEDAGAKIADGIDDATGVPVYSLYGENRRPTPDMMAGLDALVFDIQDVGARFYTFISTMGLSMQSAAEAGVPFIVLDRPNPLGGERMAGYLRPDSLVSFVSQYPIPVRHGLTVGELARMIQGKDWVPGVKNLDLRVVEMDGWERAMLWPETGLHWIAPSPNLPSFESAMIYPGTCFFEATTASEGRGTPAPFLTVGAPWLDSDALAADLRKWGTPGLRIEAGNVTPVRIPGAASNPKWKDTELGSLHITITDPDSVDAVATGLDLVGRMYRMAPDSVKDSFFRERWMALLSGSGETLERIKGGMDRDAWAWSWEEDMATFEAQRRPYLLY